MEVDNSVTASGDDKEGNPFKKKKNCDRRGKESFYNLLSSKKDGQSSTLMQKSFQILWIWLTKPMILMWQKGSSQGLPEVGIDKFQYPSLSITGQELWWKKEWIKLEN